MISKTLIVFSLILGISACGLFVDECGDLSGNGGLYRYTQANAIVMVRDNENATIAETPRDFLGSGEFGMNIEFASERISSSYGSFMTRAYACSPSEPYLEATVDSIEIYSSVPYHQDIDAAENLVEFFDVAPVYSYRPGEHEVKYNYQIPAETIRNTYPFSYPFISFYLFPTVPPSGQLDELSFTVILHLKDNLGMLETKTRTVTLIP